MLKLRNAVLTALLAFCLAMPFVSCSFNDGATGDVSNLVEQPGNNQNGGNGGSTGGNEKPSGGDEDSGDNGNENPSGGNNGGSGNENPSGGDSGTDEPGSGDETMYTVTVEGTPLMDNGEVVTIPAAALEYYKTILLPEDYTISGTTINLTQAGFEKVKAAGSGAGE